MCARRSNGTGTPLARYQGRTLLIGKIRRPGCKRALVQRRWRELWRKPRRNTLGVPARRRGVWTDSTPPGDQAAWCSPVANDSLPRGPCCGYRVRRRPARNGCDMTRAFGQSLRVDREQARRVAALSQRACSVDTMPPRARRDRPGLRGACSAGRRAHSPSLPCRNAPPSSSRRHRRRRYPVVCIGRRRMSGGVPIDRCPQWE